MNFFLIPFFILLSQIMQSINNILWISASPEYEEYKKLPWYKKGEKCKLDYIFNYRIKTVWSNWRDWGSAIIAGVIATIGWWVL